MSRHLKKICIEFSNYLSFELVDSYAPKGGRGIYCAIYKKKLNEENEIRLHLNFFEECIQSYRLGINNVVNSVEYVKFIEWSYSKYVYLDANYRLDDRTKEIYNMTIFKDYRFEPCENLDRLPEIFKEISNIEVNIDSYLEKMEIALNKFVFDSFFYEDLSVSFLIRSAFWQISQKNYERTNINELLKMMELPDFELNSVRIKEFEEYLNVLNNG